MSIPKRDLLTSFRERFKTFDIPTKAEMEHAAEACATCGKCGGGVRALIEDATFAGSVSSDMDVLVHLYCRNAACGWEARQWRPWKHTQPKVL